MQKTGDRKENMKLVEQSLRKKNRWQFKRSKETNDGVRIKFHDSWFKLDKILNEIYYK